MFLVEKQKILITDKSTDLNFKLLLKTILSYLPGSIIPAIISLISATIFTRSFSAFEYGQYSLVLSITTFVTALCSQWLQQAINRYLPIIRDEASRQEIKYTISFGLSLLLIILTIVSLVFFYAGNKLYSEWHEFLLPAILLIISTSIFGSLNAIFQAEMKATIYSKHVMINSFAQLLFSVFIVFFIFHSPSSLIWGAVISTAMLIPILWQKAELPIPLLLFKKDAIRYSAIRQWSNLMRFAAYGFPMIGWFLSATLLNVGDRYVIQWFRGSAEVGIYSANYSLIQGAAGLIAAPVFLAAYPFLMRAWGEGNKVNAGKWLGIIAEWFAAVGVVLVGATYLFSQDIAVWFLGPDFRSGYIIMPIVIAGVVAWQIGMYTHKPLEFGEKTGLLFFLSLFVAILNVVLNIIFVPTYGYVAAAYTTLASFLLYAILTAIVGQKILSWKTEIIPIIILAILTAITVIGFYWIRVLINGIFGYWPTIIFALAGYLIIEFLILRLVGLNPVRFLTYLHR